MRRFVARRLLSAVPVLIGVSILSFAILHLMPGSPVRLMLSTDERGGTAEQIEEIEHELGLDRPMVAQYGAYSWGLLQGDLGESIIGGRDVREQIAAALPHTVQLALLSMALAVVLGVTLGAVAAVYHRRWPDHTAIGLSLLGVSMPQFWLAIVAILVLSVNLALFPTSGNDGIRALWLPALVLGVRAAAAIARLTRSSMLDVLNQQYIVTAEAKGVRRLLVVGHHALRNAFIPVVTMIGLQMGDMLGGTVVSETVFNRQGVGRLMIDAVVRKDIPVLQGTILVVAVSYVLINILVDVLYAVLDPRIRYS